MRIIAGKFKGRCLTSIGAQCRSIRPTSGMVREALFSILARWNKGSFLDLFSGTGAVALEAVSRGYSPVWCIENDRKAIENIKTNAKDIGLNVVPKDVRNIKAMEFQEISVIFADPPYDKSIAMWDLLAERLAGYLSMNGVLIWECSKTCDLSNTSDLALVEKRVYGEAKLNFFERIR